MKALIIGGGIGGLAAAIALRQAGLEVEVYERATSTTETGAGISLWANALYALDKLGVGHEVRSASIPGAIDGLRTAEGLPITTLPIAELRKQLGDLFVIMIHRASLLEILQRACGEGAVHFGAQCVAIQDEGTQVTVEFSDARHITGDVLIGADGLYSIVRTALHGEMPPRYSGFTTWRAIVPFSARGLSAAEYWGDGRLFGLFPVDANRVYWYGSVRAPKGARAGSEKNELRELFGHWQNPIGALIEATNESAILRNDIFDRPPLKWWGRNRVTLVGDAAHPMTPHLGQGGCQAIEDAVVLGECMRARHDVASALYAYEKKRLARANMFVKRSLAMGRLAMIQQPLAIRVRNALLGLASKRMQVRQMASMVNYRV